jgi:hypothetical protein
MSIYISINSADGAVKAQASGNDNAMLIYNAAYADGDVIVMRSDEDGFVVTQLEDSIQPVFGWLSGEYILPVPFERKRRNYSPKSFTGELHLLWARAAYPYEISEFRNLALNPLDNHQNSAFFPHAKATVETRNDPEFAARNAINGNLCSSLHGGWPYESWGINKQDDAEIRIDFEQKVNIEKIIITLRADFPHDNWWKRAAVTFSDGSVYEPTFVKTGCPQSFEVNKSNITWLTMGKMVKDETDPSPYPALTQIEAWGRWQQ